MNKLFSIGICLLTSAALIAAAAHAQTGAAGGAAGGAGSAAAGGGTTPGAGAGVGAAVAGGQEATAGAGTAADVEAGAAGNVGTAGARGTGTLGAQGAAGAPTGVGAGTQTQTQFGAGARQGAVVQPQRGLAPQAGASGQVGVQGQAGSAGSLPAGEQSYLQGQPAAGADAGEPAALGVWLVETGDPGVEIRRTTPGSAADAAGLLPGDVLLGINGEVVASPVEVQQLIRSMRPGEVVTLDIARNGVQQQLAARLMASQRPYEVGFRGNGSIDERDLAARTARLEQQLGMVVEELRLIRRELAELTSAGPLDRPAGAGLPAGQLEQEPADFGLNRPAPTPPRAPAPSATAPAAGEGTAPLEQPAEDDLFGAAPAESTAEFEEPAPPATELPATEEAEAGAADDAGEADADTDPLFE